MTARTPPTSSRHGTTRAALCAALCAIGTLILISGIILMAVVTFTPSINGTQSALRGVADMLYADNEANIWAWYSTALLALLAASFALHAYVQRNAGGQVGPYLALAGIAAFMSADEAAILHEKLSNIVKSFPTWGWLAIGVPFAAAVGWGALWLTRSMERYLRRRLIAAGVLFLLGAFVMEGISGVLVVQAGSYDAGTHTVAYMVLLAIEEFLEMAGVLVALWATLTALDMERLPDGLLVSPAATPAEDAQPLMRPMPRIRLEDILGGPIDEEEPATAARRSG
jgi:hypothetical protein